MKSVLRGIVFILLLVLSISGTYRIISWKDTTGDYLSSVQQIQNTGEGLVDVFFIGSSHCYNSVYPEYLWRDSGIAAFDLAISGQDKWSSYYSLKEALKTQEPEVVFVDCYGLLYDGYLVEGNKYRNLLSFGLSSDNMALIEKIAGKEEKWDYFLRWPIVHTRYRELTQYDFVQYEPSVYGRGAHHEWVTGAGPDFQEARSCEAVGELSEENQSWIDDMISLSREKDFELVFFIAPMAVNEEDQTVFNSAARYVKEQGMDLIDFGKLSQELELDGDSDFCDMNHCNAYGAAKVTEYLRKYMAEHFELEDHRGESDYQLWELSYQYYCRLEMEQEYNNKTENMEEYLTRALEDEDITVILNLGGYWGGYSQELCLCLEMLGISEEDYPQGGKWVWYNGEPVFSMDSADPQVYLLELSDTEMLRIENRSVKYGEDGGTDVMINRVSYGNDSGGMFVVLYDNFRRTIIGVREV